MSDETPTQEVEPVEPTEDSTPDVQPEPKPADSMETLPDWAQKLVKDLRKENAKHRTATTAAEKAAEKQARTQAEEQGEFKKLYEETLAKQQEAETAATAANLAMLKAQVAQKTSLPDALVDRLQGETLEDLEADAQILLDAMPKAQPVTTTDSSAGVNGKQPTPPMSEAAMKEQAAKLGVQYEHLKEHYSKE